MWFIISILLIIWVVYDLFKGEVWVFSKISRIEEPVKYWLAMILWSAVACTSLYLSYYY